jgi:prolyl-tRNA synthetase
MPDGKALQMGTSHILGQNFSKPFEIKFVDKDEKVKYVWTTSWGISTRLIGALVMVHGDDKGLVLPPKVSPYQVVIVPIYYKLSEKKKVFKVGKEIAKILESNGFNVIFDGRVEYTPGWKFNEWEMKGIPLRLEIGPQDVKKNQVVAVRRDSSQKIVIKQKELQTKVRQILENIQKNLFGKAKKFLKENITTVKNYDEFKRIVESKGGFIRACWCGEQYCEEQIKNETGATIRTIPLKREKVFSSCIYCGKKADKVVYFAKAY